MDNSEILRNIYYNPSNPSAFSSPQKLYNAVDKRISLKNIRKWLMSQNTYTLHKQRRKNFVRSRITVEDIDDQFQADLVDMQAFQKENKGFKYILTVIDVFSKFAFALPLKSKNADDVIKAFKIVFSKRKPEKLQSDKGKEFVNDKMKKFLESKNIHFFTSNNENIKCSVVERFNRTLKSKMWKYFTSVGSRNWIDIISKLTEAYNNSVHRSTNKKPIDVNSGNSKTVFRTLYGFNSMRELLKNKSKNQFSVNMKIRLPHKLGPFDKSYYPLWTDQVFNIQKIKSGFPKIL